METNASEGDSRQQGAFIFSPPVSSDGIRVHELIAACPPLDPNSIYCNILQCHHFAATSVKVERDGDIVAFISGYIPPEQPDVLFIWQVAVSAAARGNGIGGRMLRHLVERPACKNVRFMHTTVTPDNEASMAMFAGFARRVEADVKQEVLFDKERHFAGKHESEVLFQIGPFSSPVAG